MATTTHATRKAHFAVASCKREKPTFIAKKWSRNQWRCWDRPVATVCSNLAGRRSCEFGDRGLKQSEDNAAPAHFQFPQLNTGDSFAG